jgi:hypothetical protein
MHHPVGMAATHLQGIARRCWHPFGMRVVTWNVTGGVATLSTRAPLSRSTVPGTLNHRLPSGWLDIILKRVLRYRNEWREFKVLIALSYFVNFVVNCFGITTS